MGLMLGEFVDDYTVRVVDAFAMPQVLKEKGGRGGRRGCVVLGGGRP